MKTIFYTGLYHTLLYPRQMDEPSFAPAAATEAERCRYYSPLVKSAALKSGTSSLRIVVKNYASDRWWVKSVMLNGKPIVDWKIRHADIDQTGPSPRNGAYLLGFCPVIRVGEGLLLMAHCG